MSEKREHGLCSGALVQAFIVGSIVQAFYGIAAIFGTRRGHLMH
jgi:hypothetical protein